MVIRGPVDFGHRAAITCSHSEQQGPNSAQTDCHAASTVRGGFVRESEMSFASCQQTALPTSWVPLPASWHERLTNVVSTKAPSMHSAKGPPGRCHRGYRRVDVHSAVVRILSRRTTVDSQAMTEPELGSRQISGGTVESPKLKYQ